MDDGGTGMRVERPHGQLHNLSKVCMPMRPLHHISAVAPMWCSRLKVMEGVYWALVVVQRLEQLGGMKGVYWALVQLQSKGRPPVRQWRGATTAGGVPKEGLPEAAWSGLGRAYIWDS